MPKKSGKSFNLKDAIVLDALTIADVIICTASKETAKVALWLYNGSGYINKIANDYKIRITKAQQWENRLSEYYATPTEIAHYWELIRTGINPYHAYQIIVDYLRIEQNK